MQARFVSWFTGLKAWWISLERGRRFAYIGAVILVILALFAFILVQVRPAWQTVFVGTNHGDYLEFTTAIREEGIRYRSPRDTLIVQVREADRNRAHAAFLAQGSGSATGWHWPDALDATGMTASRAVIEHNLLLEHQTRIEQMLTTIVGVVQAQVNLAFPQDGSIFLPSVDVPTASVMVTTNALFNRNNGDALANIVASGVIGLELENISIHDQFGNVIFSGVIGENNETLLQHELNAAMTAQISRDIRNSFAQIFDEVNVIPRFNYDWANVLITMEEFTNPMGPDTNIGLIDHDHTVAAGGQATDFAGEPGLTANDLIPGYLTGFGQLGTWTHREHTRNYINNAVRTVREEGGQGRILAADSTIAVTAIRNRPFFEQHFNEGVYDNEPGFVVGMTWEQFREAMNHFVPLDEDIRHNQLLATASGLPLENVMVLAHTRPIFHDLDITPVPWQEIIMLSVLGLFIFLLILMIIQRQKPVAVDDIEAELDVEDLLATSQLDEEREAQLREEERLREIQMQKDSEAKQMIERFVSLRPEAAAQLLRNWLNEDWE